MVLAVFSVVGRGLYSARLGRSVHQYANTNEQDRGELASELGAWAALALFLSVSMFLCATVGGAA